MVLCSWGDDVRTLDRTSRLTICARGSVSIALVAMALAACGGGRSGVTRPLEDASSPSVAPSVAAGVGGAAGTTAGGSSPESPRGDGGAGGTAAPSSDPVLFVNGQSNATTREFPEASVYDGPDLLTWTGVDWGAAQAGIAGHVGQGVGVLAGRAMRGIVGGAEVAGRVDNHGWPGQALSYFLPDSLEVAMVAGDVDPLGRNNYRLARDSWTASGVEPTVLLWVQGEANGGDSAEDYGANLESLLAAWWRDYPKLEHIVIVQTAEGACGAKTSGVRTAQASAAAKDPRIRLVFVDDLTNDPTHSNGCHYTLAGYECLADRVVLALGLLAL
jgi:hypothetical protein